MDTLTSPSPSPDNHLNSQPVTAPQAEPDPAPQGPSCHGCDEPAVVHWQRRPTATELAELHQVEEDRRAHARTLADPQQPDPVFPPLPTPDDTTIAVYACARHAIPLEAAAHIHQSTCTGCDCTPEKLPTEADTEEQRIDLPASWLPGDQ
ncbi:hypothetical protein ACIQMP_07660 [Streptomyces sp. NPDC091385]|uniref:hypothetical protein n=1 Tax=Streptomyces sp. NPDC091385 TaxID=3365997 RepID=UPI00380C3D16